MNLSGINKATLALALVTLPLLGASADTSVFGVEKNDKGQSIEGGDANVRELLNYENKINYYMSDWDILTIAASDGKAMIFLEDEEISIAKAISAVKYVFCNKKIIKENSDYLRSTKEAALLNRYGTQGYFFEGSREACSEISTTEFPNSLVRSRLRLHSLE